MTRVNYIAPVTIEGYFPIKHVKRHDGNLYTAKVMEKLTKPLNLNGMLKEYNDALKKGNPVPISLDDFFAINKSALFRIKNEEQIKGDLAKFLKFERSVLRENSPNFYTLISWVPEKGKDKIVHYRDSQEEYLFEGEFAGEDDFISKMKNKTILKPLTGISNISLLKRISHLINRTTLYQGRVNQKPSDKVENIISRVAGLFADSYTMYLYSNRPFPEPFRSLRVEWIKE